VEVEHGRRWRGMAENVGRWCCRGAEGRAECQRRKKRGGGPKDLVGICKNLRDSSVNWIFLLIQSSNEEMVKIEVVDLFKSYNFTLGFKFKNLKHDTLFYHFALKSNLNKFCPSQGKFLITLDLIASIYDMS
jgi:hypothetical protein